MTDKRKQEFLRKMTKKWIEDNKGVMTDYLEICRKVFMFNAMWGINIGITFNPIEERKGRQLGEIK